MSVLLLPNLVFLGVIAVLIVFYCNVIMLAVELNTVVFNSLYMHVLHY